MPYRYSDKANSGWVSGEIFAPPSEGAGSLPLYPNTCELGCQQKYSGLHVVDPVASSVAYKLQSISLSAVSCRHFVGRININLTDRPGSASAAAAAAAAASA